MLHAEVVGLAAAVVAFIAEDEEAKLRYASHNVVQHTTIQPKENSRKMTRNTSVRADRQQHEEMVAVCDALTAAEIPGVHATVGNDHGRRSYTRQIFCWPQFEAVLTEYVWWWRFSKVALTHNAVLADCRHTGKSPTVEIVLTENWHGPNGKELLRLLRDEPLPGHPRVYVGGDIRTTDTTMTVVRTTKSFIVASDLFARLSSTYMSIFPGSNDVAARGMDGCQQRIDRGTC